MIPLKIVLFTAIEPGFEKLAYHDQWTRAWMEHPGLRPKVLNLSTGFAWRRIADVMTADLVVFLHSTNSNEIVIPNKLRKLLRYSRAQKLFFVGNEYKLIPEKLALLDELRIDFVCSQLPQSAATWLYQPCRGSRVLSVPHALDADRYRPKIEIRNRPLDIGVRAFEYPWYLGDRDRAEIIEAFQNTKPLKNLRTDISMDATARFTGDDWANFLNSCRATISTEAGVTYLRRDDKVRDAVNLFQAANPNATFADVYERFFRNGVEDSMSGKCISSRHFEAIGTRTTQIMFPGEFNGILKADVNYISLARDYSNLSDVLDRLQDTAYLEKISAATLEYCLAEHTFSHRIRTLLDQVRE